MVVKSSVIICENKIPGTWMGPEQSHEKRVLSWGQDPQAFGD